MQKITTNPRGFLQVFFILLATGSLAPAQSKPAIEYAGDPRMGTCTHFAQGWDYQKVMPLIEQSGISWIRDDLGWESCEKAKGVYRMPERSLAWIRAAHAHHLRVLLIVNGSNKLYADKYDPQAFAAWTGWVAKELKDDVDALEILNEPNNFGFSKYYGGQHEGEGDSPWVAKYVTLMNKSAEAIKAANPAMPVIGFGAGAAVTYKQLEIGASPAVDAIADHPYSNHQPPELIPGSASEQVKHFGRAFVDERGTFVSLVQGFRDQSAKHNGPKGIWLTEWGFSTFQPLTQGQFGGFTEEAQAKYILRRFMEGMGLGVDVSFLYEFRDERHDDHNAEDCWGLVRRDGDPKESYDAVVNLAAAMKGYRVAKDDEIGAVSVFPAACWSQQAPVAVYKFVDAQHRPAVAIWATDRAGGDLQPRIGDVELAWGKDVKEITAVDLLTGKREPIAFKQNGGRLIKTAMTLRDYPIILQASVPATASGVKPDDAQKNLGLFDANAKWWFIDGREFPGAAGSFELGTDGGKSVGDLKYDFTKGGAYVAAETEIRIPNTAGELRIGVKSSRNMRVTVRLIDATGQCHQFQEPCSGTGAWETLRVALDSKPSEHWGGANDGKLHFPLRKLSLGVGKPSGDDKTGTTKFGDAVTVPK